MLLARADTSKTCRVLAQKTAHENVFVLSESESAQKGVNCAISEVFPWVLVLRPKFGGTFGKFYFMWGSGSCQNVALVLSFMFMHKSNHLGESANPYESSINLIKVVNFNYPTLYSL